MKTFLLRMYQAKRQISTEEQDDLVRGGWGGWYTPDDAEHLSQFSAICFLTARAITDILGNDNGRRVIGLIQSAWGGTRVEAWSSEAALSTCNVPPNDDGLFPPNRDHVLWNAMVYPFLRHQIFMTLWYQGKRHKFIPM